MLEYDKRYRAANAGESRTGQPFAPDPPGTLPGCPPSRGRPRCRYWRVGCQAPVTRGGVHCRGHGLAFARAAEAWRRDRLAAKLAAAQDWICTWCCQPLPADLGWTNIDHVIPASRGGPHDRWNLDVLHSRCNIAKRDKITPRALELAADHGITIAAYLDRAGVTESVSAGSAAAIVIPRRRRVTLTEGPPIPAARATAAATLLVAVQRGLCATALASVPGRECNQPFVGFAEVEREPLQPADHVPQLGELAR